VHHVPGTPALENINLSISGGQKISICGRTGSGKSTLLSTLLRTLTPTTGTLLIDGIDLSTLSRPSIRRHLTTIPQTPLWLPGSLRANLDPFSSSTDEALITALQKVRLWDILEQRGGLDAEIHAEELSAGQEQLLSLARAIVNKKKVVLMDEATSSIDAETERIVRAVVRAEFETCTVLTVAHRRETILDGDVVVVLEGGRVVETGRPGELMLKVDGKLRALLGSGEAI
jgi:ATP-binding cassette subfamily C (CFTR/MRP) protein 1